MRIEGKITTWKDEQGYGFITPDNGGAQAFVHIKAFLDGRIRPVVNDPVSFELTTDEQGRPQARYVRRGGAAFRFRSINKSDAALFLGIAIFIGALTYLALANWLQEFVPLLYLGLSYATYRIYSTDKNAAKEGRWRTQESILQALSLAGGWPGALVAQRVLHHKSRKVEFLAVFWLTVVANVGVLGLSLTPQGAQIIQNVLNELTRDF